MDELKILWSTINQRTKLHILDTTILATPISTVLVRIKTWLSWIQIPSLLFWIKISRIELEVNSEGLFPLEEVDHIHQLFNGRKRGDRLLEEPGLGFGNNNNLIPDENHSPEYTANIQYHHAQYPAFTPEHGLDGLCV